MLLSGRMSATDFIGYVVAQIAGAFAGAGVLYLTFYHSGLRDTLIHKMGTNGYGDLSNIHVSMWGALLIEIVLTCIFVFVILRVTTQESFAPVSGLIIGLTLTLVHLLGINITGTSVNPARSLAPAVFVGGEPLTQVWVFIVAPLIGAAIAALAAKLLADPEKTKKAVKKSGK